mmetsp:Transcript_10221/g.30179  ORF Transcript_10221/g.30179 Transcript_10221/m.30179 type:complete len:842 (-) Transcript_10221:1449-3974(-)
MSGSAGRPGVRRFRPSARADRSRRVEAAPLAATLVDLPPLRACRQAPLLAWCTRALRRVRVHEVVAALDVADEVAHVEAVANLDGDAVHDARDGRGDGGLHLHGRHDGDALPLLDGVALGHLDADDHAGQARADRPGVDGVSLLARLARGEDHAVVAHGHHARLAVDLEQHRADAVGLRLGDAEHLDLALLARVVEEEDGLALLQGVQEGVGGQHAHVAVLEAVLLEVVEDGGVERVGHRVLLRQDGLGEARGEELLRALEVEGRERRTRAPLDGGFTLEHLRAQRLGEAAGRDADVTAQVAHHGGGQVKLPRAGRHVLRLEAVGHHEVCQVAHHLGRGRHLDHVAEQLVGLGVGALHLRPPALEAQLARLEEEVGVLAARDLVDEHVRGPRELAALEGRVELARLLPVLVEARDRLEGQSRVQLAAREGADEGAHGGLRGHAAHRVDGAVHHVRARLRRGEHGGDARARRVVRVHVDGQVRELCADGADEHRRRLGLEQASHVLDGEHVDAQGVELAHVVHVVVQGVLALGRVAEVARVAHGRLDDAARGADGLDAELHVVDVVERVEDAEHIHAVLHRELAELVHHVVGVGGVAHGVGAAQQHLEGHVRRGRAQGAEAVPGVLAEEAHGHVEGGAAPHLQGEGVAQRRVRGGRAGEQVVGAHASGEQRLVRVAPRRVREQHALVRAHRLGEALGALAEEHLAPAVGCGLGARGRLAHHRRLHLLDAGRDARGRAEALGLTVHGDGGHVICEEVHLVGRAHRGARGLRGPAHARALQEQRAAHLDVARVHPAGHEDLVRHDREQKVEVGAHAVDGELREGAAHARARRLEGVRAGGDLGE